MPRTPEAPQGEGERRQLEGADKRAADQIDRFLHSVLPGADLEALQAANDALRPAVLKATQTGKVDWQGMEARTERLRQIFNPSEIAKASIEAEKNDTTTRPEQAGGLTEDTDQKYLRKSTSYSLPPTRWVFPCPLVVVSQTPVSETPSSPSPRRAT